MLKIMTIIGTRPEVIRLSRIIVTLDKNCDHCLLHTGQNFDYELNQIFFEQMQIRKPDIFLEVNGKTAAETIAQIISKIDIVLNEQKPDAVLILGDTNSALASIAVKRRHIPIFHLEAGNRSFDQRIPEEINRKIVDHISDINLTYSSIAREYLLREGFPPDQVIKVGSPILEVLEYYLPKINSSDILKKLNLTEKKYFIISAHREENIDSDQQFNKLVVIINLIAQRYNIDVIISTHPRTQKKIDEKNIKFNSNVRLLKPLGYFDYVNLQINAKAVLSDSGTITEESSVLNFPALNIREAHERPEGMEEGSVMMTGLEKDRVIECLDILENQKVFKDRSLQIVSDYNVKNVSDKVLRIIFSYTDYVNRVVWKKY